MLEPDPELAVAYGIFTVRQARAAGHSRADIERLVRTGTWRREGGGLLSVIGRPGQSTDELVRAALVAGPEAVVGGLPAAALRGWELRRDPNKPYIIVPQGASGKGNYRSELSPEDIAVHGCLRVTSASRTALDVAVTGDFDEAVIALDSAVRAREITYRELEDAFRSSQRRGVRRAREVLAAVDARSGSVPETEARLLFARSDLPPCEPQRVIRVGGHFVGRADFGWDESLLAAEIDGFRYHSAEGEFQADRIRQNAVQLGGWLVLRFTVADIRRYPDEVVALVRQGMRRFRP